MRTPTNAPFPGQPGLGASLGLLAVNSALLVAAGLAPTGQRVIDVFLVVALGSAWLFVSAGAPWWSLAMLGAVGAVAAGSIVAAVAGLGGLAIAASMGARRRHRADWAMLAGLLGLQAVARLTPGRWFGLSSVVGLAAVVGVAGVATARWPSAARRRVVAGLGLAIAGVALSLVGLAAASASAKPSFEDANATVHRAFRALEDGDARASAREFDAASRVFARIARELDRPWSRPSRLLPVVAQHHAGVARLAAGAARLSNDLAVVLTRIDPDALSVSGGRLDMASLRDLAEPAARLEHSLGEFDELLSSVESPWLVDPLQDALADLDAEVERSHEAAVNLQALADELPDLLGASGPRRYFVGFITPAEARGLGGFMGNYAELTAVDGTVTMTAFGRLLDLEQAAPDPAAWKLDLPAEFSSRYGDFGFAEPDGGVSPSIWSNVTMSPDLPSVARVISQLYPQSGGSPIDGVIMLDPSAMAALMELTGPIEIPTRTTPLTSADAEDYIVRGQYEVASHGDRVDGLEVLARGVMDRLLGTDLPGPWRLSRLMGPVLARNGLMLWSTHPSEEAMFETVGVSGSLPDLAGRDGISVVVNNASANKIDAYLQRSVKYRVSVDPDRGVFKATASVALHNTAPDAGLADYVIGNTTKDPIGSNRTYLSLYSAFPVAAARLDGVPMALEVTTERGWTVSSAFVVIPPGSTRTVEVEVFGAVGPGGYRLVWRPQPSVLATAADVAIFGPGGVELSSWVGPEARRDKVVTIAPVPG